MPKQSPSQIIGREGEKWFEAQLPPSWVPQRPTEDIGIDLQVVICEDSVLNGLEFRVQIKSTRFWQMRDGHVLLRFSRSSLIELIKGYIPTLLVIYESSSKRGYCFWLNQLAGKDLSLLRPGRKSVTLAIPATRPINAHLWKSLGQEVRGLNAAFGRRVLLAGRSFPILRFVHAMSDALRLFDFVAANWDVRGDPSSEKATFLHASEIVGHLNVIRAIDDLRETLPPEFNPIIGLDDFSQRWIESCESFIPQFRDLVHDDGPNLVDRMMRVSVDYDRMAEKRIGFVRSILDVQVQITELGVGIQASGDNNDLGIA